MKWFLKWFRPWNPPQWYSAQELWEVLRREESAHLANRLAVEYAKNLQLAFNKGYELGHKHGLEEGSVNEALKKLKSK